jgi:predicted DNA-binding transcriptional regulator YafY
MVRQWTILRTIASSATVTVKTLERDLGVNERTIRRDLAALQEAGFPLYRHEPPAGAHFWRLSGPLGKLGEAGFTLAELCAFYANRERLAAAGASPIDADLESAMAKVAKALNPRMKKYLDDLGKVMECKPEPEPRVKGDARTRAASVETLARAAVEHRRVLMDYHSFRSRKVKTYTVEPHRLTFTNGGLYLYAFVPAYSQMRTFALQRVRRLKLLDERFTPGEVPAPYVNSMGPYAGGKPELVEIEFLPSVAPYVEEREWHPSQQVTRRDDGSLVLRLQIAVDPALRCWILGFGGQARVLKPSALATDILEELEDARGQYVPPIPFDDEPPLSERAGLAWLPFSSAPPAAERPASARRGTAARSKRTPSVRRST